MDPKVSFIKTLDKISNNIPSSLFAISLMIISGLFFVLMHSAVKYLSKEVHIFEIAFFRCALVIFVLAPIIFQQGKKIFKTKQPKVQFLRITTNSVAMLCFFYGISTTPLAQLTTLGFTVPIFATILAVIFMKEKIRLRRTTALIVGFIGTIIVMRPDISIELGALLIIFSSFLWSICLIFIKKLTETDSAVTISLFPFDFLRLIWSVLIGYALFSEEPTITLWLGGFLIIGSTSYIAWREATLKKVDEKL